jgi:hypothetical protein
MKKIAFGWGMFLAGPFAFTLWDRAVAALRHAPLRTLECFEPRTVVLLAALLACSVWGTHALKGGWGTLLRILLVLGQLWMAVVLQLFVLEPIQAETGGYAGGTCGDL